jgi:hypothetical protein
MTQTITNGHTMLNPMAITIQEAENLIVTLNASANRYAETIAYEQSVYGLLKSAQEDLDAAESEVINEAVIQALDKTGPLAGIATTSKAYDHALKTLLGNARSNLLSHLHAEVQRLRLEHQQAQIDRQQAEIHFSAVRNATKVKAAILEAMKM